MVCITNLKEIERLKEREIKKLFISFQEELKLIKNDIQQIKNKEIPEHIKIRIKKLEVTTLGVEEQIVSLEDRMRVIETSFKALEDAFLLNNNNFDTKMIEIDNEIIDTKAQFNVSLQELDERKEDKEIIEDLLLEK